MDLRIEGVSKAYAGDVPALRDVSLTIPPGLFGLLGPGGAGKSTLLRIVAALLQPDAGCIRLGGIDAIEQREQVLPMLGHLPQRFAVFPRVTAEDLLDHTALHKGITERRARTAAVDSALRRTGLWQDRRLKLAGYTCAMRRRLGIAIALLGDARLLLLDEPTAGLDQSERRHVLDLLSTLGDDRIVIIATRRVEDVRDLCTRFAIINDGQILLDAEPQRAIDSLRGRIWRRQTAWPDLHSPERGHTELAESHTAGRTVAPILSDTPPGPGFAPAEPDLEDVYRFALAGHSRRGREHIALAAAS